MNRYIQPFSDSVIFFSNKALWFNLISKSVDLCEHDLSRVKLVGASPRGGTWREAGFVEIYPRTSNKFLAKQVQRR